jgi:hypothetical protein
MSQSLRVRLPLAMVVRPMSGAAAPAVQTSSLEARLISRLFFTVSLDFRSFKMFINVLTISTSSYKVTILRCFK